MRKVYDMSVRVRTYQDRSGNEKSEWLNIGVVMENDKGMFAMLKPHVNLAALPRRDGGDVMVSLFEPRERDAGQRSQPASQQASQPAGGGYDDLSDEIPFAACWEV